MSTISFGGLASGLDTTQLIGQLVAVAKQPATALQTHQANLASQKRIVDGLAASMSALGTFADGLKLGADVTFRTATASDGHVAVAASGDATATSHLVRVQQTARAQVTSSRTFTTSDAGVLGAGNVTIQVGVNTPVVVSWGASDSLAAIASRINDADVGVGASVLYDGAAYRLIVTADTTGTAAAPTFTFENGDGLGLADPANLKIAARNAIVSIDGVDVTRPTNVISDALAGVTITASSAHAAGDPDTEVAITHDGEAAQGKLEEFVKHYNAIGGAITAQLTYTGATKSEATLFGDSTLRQLSAKLAELATSTFGAMTMSDLGLTIDKVGAMSLDTVKLGTALGANPNALGDLFVTGQLSQQLAQLRDAYTRAGDGILTIKSTGSTQRSTDLQEQIDRINEHADALETRLRKQFDALEVAMSKLRSQGTYISSLFSQKG